MRLKLIIASFIFCSLIHDYQVCSQSRWENQYFPGSDVYSEGILEHYDKGYLLTGRHGANYPNYAWVLKTDINGQVLWNKTLGNEGINLVCLDMDMNMGGELFIAGSSYLIDGKGDAFIAKFNSCIEKQWCKIWNIPNFKNYATNIIGLDDGSGIAALYNPQHYKIDHLCLIKLDADGEMVWYNCLNSQDTSLTYPMANHILLTQDNGLLISGDCYYKDPNQPNLSWIKPYYIKTDSLGNIEWETVIHSDLGGEAGGVARSTTLNPSGTYYYSSLKHYYPGDDITPALVNLDLDGNVIGIYDLNSQNTFGGLSHATFINDSVLAGGAGWGTSSSDVVHHAVLIDTIGNVIDSLPLIQDIYSSTSIATSEEKLVYMYNTYQSGQFDVYLTKLNYDLESDTINPYPFTYDSLCPNQIPSDTIGLEDCGLIVNMQELQQDEMPETSSIMVYPNPASSEIRFQLSAAKSASGGLKVGSRQWGDGCVVEVWDLFGRKVEAMEVPPGQTELRSDVSGWPPGIYIAILRNDREILARRKFMVAR